ncbi:MAG: PIN domain-containing protein, partial [Rhodoferax sp.]|nr:PIN domain-containing protein [Rhodoferax sp.]
MPSTSQFPTPLPKVVLDTNIVLDAFVFDDPAARPLKQALAAHQLQWVATKAMRDE